MILIKDIKAKVSDESINVVVRKEGLGRNQIGDGSVEAALRRVFFFFLANTYFVY